MLEEALETTKFRLTVEEKQEWIRNNNMLKDMKS